jgi:UTP--glucose-1-phosphate uridylyltransferase
LKKSKIPGAAQAVKIQLTDVIAALMKDEQVLSFEFAGNQYDGGSKFGFLLANVEYGLLHQEINAEFAAYLKQLVCKI